MALTPDHPADSTDPTDAAALVARAAQVARDAPAAPEADWPAIQDSVMARVRDVVTPAEPLLAHGPEGDDVRDREGSRIYVSSRVLRTMLRDALHQPDQVLHDLDLETRDRRLHTIRVDLVCRYGVDLRAVVEASRREVHAMVRDLLGPDPDFALGQVQVRVVDVVLGHQL